MQEYFEMFIGMINYSTGLWERISKGLLATSNATTASERAESWAQGDAKRIVRSIQFETRASMGLVKLGNVIEQRLVNVKQGRLNTEMSGA